VDDEPLALTRVLDPIRDRPDHKTRQQTPRGGFDEAPPRLLAVDDDLMDLVGADVTLFQHLLDPGSEHEDSPPVEARDVFAPYLGEQALLESSALP